MTTRCRFGPPVWKARDARAFAVWMRRGDACALLLLLWAAHIGQFSSVGSIGQFSRIMAERPQRTHRPPARFSANAGDGGDGDVGMDIGAAARGVRPQRPHKRPARFEDGTDSASDDGEAVAAARAGKAAARRAERARQGTAAAAAAQAANTAAHSAARARQDADAAAAVQAADTAAHSAARAAKAKKDMPGYANMTEPYCAMLEEVQAMLGLDAPPPTAFREWGPAETKAAGIRFRNILDQECYSADCVCAGCGRYQSPHNVTAKPLAAYSDKALHQLRVADPADETLRSTAALPRVGLTRVQHGTAVQKGGRAWWVGQGMLLCNDACAVWHVAYMGAMWHVAAYVAGA